MRLLFSYRKYEVNMGLPAKLVHAQLQFFRPFVNSLSLDALRKGQTKLGELMRAMHKRDVNIRLHSFPDFEGCWIVPKDIRRQGVVLYLHGGGYGAGDLHYAQGFGSTLSDIEGVRVFAAAYRLAPEHPFPAALEDGLTAYRYLLSKGYAPKHILLCGESAGGGLCYCLQLKLKELGLPMPGGVLAISPWTDVSNSAPSIELNRELDPSLSPSMLDFYAESYAQGEDRDNPFLSPLFGTLTSLPPSLIFAGDSELLLDDSKRMHDRLLSAGNKSTLHIGKERWHCYVLYQLQEDEKEWQLIHDFFNGCLGSESKRRWMRLDNAAKIFPASGKKNWNNYFRISATMSETVDRELLQQALDVTVRRFPSIAVRLRRGLFWYYLEELDKAPSLREESACPLYNTGYGEMRQCALRVIVYKKRIAVEFFHALTDGSGGLIFLKTLLAEYISQRYGVYVPSERGVLGRLEEPSSEELEDSFLRYAGKERLSRRESTAYRLKGTAEAFDYRHLVTLMLDVGALKEKARGYGVSITEFLAAAMMQAILKIQEQKQPLQHRRRPVKLMIPVNLRKLFPSRSLRNFSLYITTEADGTLGSYAFEELCSMVHHQMRLYGTQKRMQARLSTNVGSEQSLLLKLMPLFIKNLALKTAFNTVGERKSCLSLSNLGKVDLPEAMEGYVERMDLVLCPQANAPHNVGVISYGGKVYISIIRKIKEPELEYMFFKELKGQGLNVKVESNEE